MLTERAHTGEFLRSEAPGHLSRETIIIDASQTLLAGQVLGKKTRGGVTVTAGAVVSGSGGTAGNGAIGTVTADDNAPAGRYWQLFVATVTNLGTFVIFKPDGSIDGVGHVGAAYNGTINFTQADGSADFVVGDARPIDVSYAAGNGRYVVHDPEGINGSEVAAAILWADVTTAAGETAQAVGITRLAEVISARLVWDDHDAGEKTAALAQLAAAFVIAR